MSRKSYQILSTLYGLLGEHDSEHFLEASTHQDVSSSLGVILRMLAEESSRIESSGTKNDRQPKEALRAEKKRTELSYKKAKLFSPSSLSPKIDPAQYAENLIIFLNDAKFFPSKHELQDLAIKTNLPIEIDARASRDRTARKIAIEGAKSDVFKERLFEIVQNDASKQTQGWLDIIRKSK